ncbi:MAG: DUF29 domain-containing protein [Cyanophyceae cyanobacterium]
MKTRSATQVLFETDYYQWTQGTVKHLQNRDVENLDWEHLIEEVELLGISAKNTVKGSLEVLLVHLLYYQYWYNRREYLTEGWADEIEEFRSQFEKSLASRSLYNYMLTILDQTYAKAKRRAVRRFVRAKLIPPQFPDQCPYSIAQLFDENYFPEFKSELESSD